MRLKSFHVRVFRNIIDSGSITVESNTCLVGKNEAGKSALISALNYLNPAKPLTIALLDEYPRWLKKEHEITGQITAAVPITATYELTEEEYAALEQEFGALVLTSREITAQRRYVADTEFKLPIDEAAFLKGFLARQVNVETLIARLRRVATSEALFTLLGEIAEEVTQGTTEPTPEAQAAKQVKLSLVSILGDGNLLNAITTRVKDLLPRTFYFGQYSQLRGRYQLSEVLPALTTPSEDEEIQAAANFLRLARIEEQNVASNDFESSNAELEAVSSLLTKRVKANWKQNQHLKLSVRIEIVPNKASPGERHLQFRVEDTRHDFSSRLDRRSTGFQWFVSFIASFLEFEKDKNLILLLDEPGLSLHARAQMDLLDAIDQHLTVGRQVIYTTHSPFMVRTEALHRARIVEDQGPELGSVVSNDAGTIKDPDTLFPLQAALGYDIAQNLFIGSHNIIMEGVSDVIYLKILSTFLSSKGRTSLPEIARLLPAGGATDISTFIALLGAQLQVVVLLDGNAQRQRIENAIAQGRLSAQRVISIDSFTDVKGGDIEDLFTPHEYVAIYNGTFRKTIAVSDLHGSDRIVKRIERFEGAEFNHGRVAEYFLANQANIIPKLSGATLDRFENLISALEKALPRIDGADTQPESTTQRSSEARVKSRTSRNRRNVQGPEVAEQSFSSGA